MYCLENWIGVLGCEAEESLSGIYVNSLPGVSLESIDKIADADQVTFKGVWNDIQIRAIRRFENDVVETFKKRYRIKKVAETIDLLKYIDKTSITAAVDELRGFTFELIFKNDSRIVASNLYVLSIQELSIYLPSNYDIQKPVTVYIYDMVDGTKLDEIDFDVTLVAGTWVKKQVNKRYYDVQRVFICYNAEFVDSVKQELKNSYPNLTYWSDSIYGINNIFSKIRGAVGSDTVTPTDANIVQGSNTFGLSGIFSLSCRYDFLVCKNKDVFTSAWWFLLGTELMVETIYTNRLNFFTLNKDEAKALKDYFQVEYEKAIAQACDDIDIDLNDACVECHAPIQVHEARL